MGKLSFVIPVYRSQATIRQVVNEIVETVSDRYDYEIILVNDCSPDDVFNEITRICGENACVVGVDLARNFGQHSALLAGFHYVSGDIVICLDDDGQTPAKEVISLLKELEGGRDLVFAKYPIKKHSLFRNFGSFVNEIMLRVLLAKPKNLSVTSYFACRRFVIDEVVKYENPYPYITGLLLRTTKNISNVPVNHSARVHGVSGYTMKKLLSLWINGFTAFSVKPLRMATVLGFISAVFGFLYATFTIIRKLLYPQTPMGYSSIMAVLLIIGGIIMLMLGMIGEYVGRIYISINRAPQYVVKNTINLVDKPTANPGTSETSGMI